jgi:TolA-binding protein
MLQQAVAVILQEQRQQVADRDACVRRCRLQIRRLKWQMQHQQHQQQHRNRFRGVGHCEREAQHVRTAAPAAAKEQLQEPEGESDMFWTLHRPAPEDG